MRKLEADDPRTIGKYRLLGRLGSGGMGRVYLARSEGGRTVAVKLVKAELAAEQEFRSRFRLEVEAARRVGERWTAPVLDADTEAENPWVATGYIAGPSLEQVVSSRVREDQDPLPENSVRTLAYGLAGALVDIHGAGVVHRDLKPSNVLVTIDGPRVIDFGIVRALDALPETGMTNTGVVVGSPSYMSPEQIRAQRITPASDVFSMGAVLAYTATGRTPFGSERSAGIHAVMFRIASEEPDLDGVEEPLRGLIASCLAKDPEARPTPEAVLAQTDPAASGTAAAPWLPAELIAELGRHAVQLLDTDTPPSGSGAMPVLGSEALTAAGTGVAPAGSTSVVPDPGTNVAPTPGTGGPGAPAAVAPPAQSTAPAPTPKRRGLRITIGVLAAAFVLSVAGILAGQDFPFGFGGSVGPQAGADDNKVPESFLGTWSGPVVRDGKPNGQHRRFVIKQGEIGSTVADSFSLGTDYECLSSAKLYKTSEDVVELTTKVTKSLPETKCSALGTHKLTRTSAGTLKWEAEEGRNATLHKVETPEKLPETYLGTWERALAPGGTQRLTVRQVESGQATVDFVSELPIEHCVAEADIFSVGGYNEKVRIGPTDIDRAKSTGKCPTGFPSILRVDGDSLVRHFERTGTSMTYNRVR